MAEEFRRKTPEEILQSIKDMQRGRLKIILGVVSGSGKTYHMLYEGYSLKKKGLHVVIGVVSPTITAKILEQMQDLEVVPPIEWHHKGEIRRDLDVETILSKHPDVVLVDDLAHRNRPNAPRPTRLDDVLYLIDQGISVITTVNIYELKGIHHVAKELTGVKVQVENCVPADTLSLADEVKLLDVTPEAILQRIQEEKIQTNKLYQLDNLVVLRELALRIVAEEVNEDLAEYRETHGMVGASGATERILVTVQYHLTGSILIRRGQQIAKRLGGDLLAVCFRNPNKTLSKEEATFKRSIKKLVEKIGGTFEEVSISSDDEVAEGIVRYATQHNVTRIVLGQSKRTRWEEILKGSIINQILRKTKNIDIFIMADRAEKKGERILPARRVRKKSPHPYHKLTPEEMEKEIGKIKRGKLKVYIGAAPGVGKTYTMLREANELKKKGIDVVIGLLETHGRKETWEQVGDLEIIPRKKIQYRNVILEEMDTDAIIKRNPEVVLVDELAHTNVSGSKYQKRYQGVEQILNAGISVISTMNIQHLESLNDAVEQITGIRVRETVPDHVLHSADEIELIDISPKALRERMREGNIYPMEKVEQSLNNFFRTGNLIALRELALREVADEVDERLESWDRRTLRGHLRQQEAIVVCVNLQPDSDRLIRRGFRIAYRLKAEWYVVYVKDQALTPEEEQRLQKLKELTERLGGKFEIHQAAERRKVFRKLVEVLNQKEATQVVIGHSARTRWEEIWKGAVVQKLLRAVRHLDVLVVADPALH
ncbi:universal stress protein [Bacillota bacterium LX-D]|nr:universal stress protein [Bacillota bacterium LX-D]